MDLFGRKRIAHLERQLAGISESYIKLDFNEHKLANQVEYLLHTIREMDQQIFTMSQCTDWDSMRPHFANLLEGTMLRKRQESDRIGDLVNSELRKMNDAQNQTPSRHPPRLARS